MNSSNAVVSENLLSFVKEAEAQIGTLPQSEQWKQELDLLSARLTKQEHTIAVFGAFSAGKSSLLNALLEKQELVVSPNPTTAAVTHLYADERLIDGTATVYAKSREQMWDDIFQAFSSIHMAPSSLDEAMSLAKSLKIADFSAHARKSVSFLLAAAKGYEAMSERLGTQFVIQPAEVRAFTAQEEFACYVSRVDIVQNTELLKNGFVLVDTPGVDSIHKRHTDVAFEYMRKADAIVFVLYYTHAFSRADKEFLLQLSGVQDVAGSDKLFVVINAVDLAKSEDEQIAVRERVYDELRQIGIRKPRVYEVSSQIGFAAAELTRTPAHPQFEKLVRLRMRLSESEPIPDSETLYRKSGVPVFINDLKTFIRNQSKTLMRESVLRTLSTIGEQVGEETDRIELFANQDENRTAELRKIYAQLACQWNALGDEVAKGLSSEETTLRKDWEELVFHAGERVRFRFSALFREAFNPGLFRVGLDSKHQLNEAGTDFAASLERMIEIEVRTYTLRIGQAILSTCEHFHGQIRKMCIESKVPVIRCNTRTIAEQSFDGAIRAELSLSPIGQGYKYFSSPKQFFEGDGASLMMNAIEEGVLKAVRQELRRLTEMVSEQYIIEFRQSAQNLLNIAADSALSNEGDGNFKDIQENLTRWLQVKSWFGRNDWGREYDEA